MRPDGDSKSGFHFLIDYALSVLLQQLLLKADYDRGGE